jgi:hypothetical protein
MYSRVRCSCRGERLPVPPLGDLRTRGSEPEQEPTTRQHVERRGGHRGHGRAASRDLEDPGAELDPFGPGGEPGQHGGGIRSVRLGHPHRIEPQRLSLANEV